MKDLKTWLGVGIVVGQIVIMVFGFFINRTLSQIDSINQDQEMRIRYVERLASDNAKDNDNLTDLMKSYLDPMRQDITSLNGAVKDLNNDIKEIKSKMK